MFFEEYGINKKVASNLISLLQIELSIINEMGSLLDLETAGLKNDPKYNQHLQHLNIFLAKEDKCLAAMPHDVMSIMKIEVFLAEQLSTLLTLDSDYLALITTRLQNAFAVMADLELDDEYEDDDFDIYPEDYYSIIRLTENKILKQMEEAITQAKDPETRQDLIEQKYFMALQSQTISKELLTAIFNGHNLLDIDENVEAEKLDMSKEQYQALKQEVLFEYAQEVIDSVIALNNESEDSLLADLNFECNLQSLPVIMQELDTSLLVELQELNQYNLENDYQTENESADVYEALEKIINAELSTRLDLPRPLEENEVCMSIDEDKTNTFASIVKLEETLLTYYDQLAFLEAKNYLEKFRQVLHTISSLNKIEQEFFDNFQFNQSEASVFSDILETSLPLFFTKETSNKQTARKERLIRKRLYSAFPDLIDKFICPVNDSDLAIQIYKSHELNCLKEFQALIERTRPAKRQPLIMHKYEEFFVDHRLTQDMVVSEGYPEDCFIIDDDLNAQIFNADRYSFNYDRNNELYVYAISQMQNLLEFDDTEFKSPAKQVELQFILISLRNISNCLSAEEFACLHSQFEILKEGKDANSTGVHKLDNFFKAYEADFQKRIRFKSY